MKPCLWIDVPNLRYPVEGVCTGGRPRPQQLHQATAGGLKAVISLCASCERSDYDEAALVASLGMRYLNIPIAGPDDLTLANAQLQADMLRDTRGQYALVHCASGNRVGALFALKAHFIDGLSAASSLAVGRSAGLCSLEVEVSRIFSTH